MRAAEQGKGYLELDLARRGAIVCDVNIEQLPGGVASVRWLPNGHSVFIGNRDGGVFVWELERDVIGRQRLYGGIERKRG